MAAVRGLIEATRLPHREISERTGVPEGTVARWGTLFRWRRPGQERQADERAPRRKRGAPYGEAQREAARAAIEGSRASLLQIEQDLGISTATLSRWQRAGRWRRPGHPDGRARPARYKRKRGRPYAADVDGAVWQLVIKSDFSQERIAKQVGIAQATVSEMIKRRGWQRPPAQPGSPRFHAIKRTAPLRTSGDRRGLPYAPETVAAARELFQQTRLPAQIIAARVRIGVDTLYRWKKAGGWTRAHRLPDVYGRPQRKRRR